MTEELQKIDQLMRSGEPLGRELLRLWKEEHPFKHGNMRMWSRYRLVYSTHTSTGIPSIKEEELVYTGSTLYLLSFSMVDRGLSRINIHESSIISATYVNRNEYERPRFTHRP